MVAEQHIKIPYLTWLRLVTELRKRGNGCRESGAFLLGKINSSKQCVETFICYDDLDRDALLSGIVIFNGSGFSKLWDICSAKGLRVIADVHTHPTADVRQSSIDKRNPMIPMQGHTALIMPKYGKTSKYSLAGIGIHVFQGQGRWKSFSHNDPDAPVSLKLW
jgi:proteasome lid subunit RPN8/RPN11